MRKWRQKLASALIVSMMMNGALTGVAMAETVPDKKGWYLTEEGWVHWKENKDGTLEQDKNKVKRIKERNGKELLYCFNEAGIMASDEVVGLNDDQYNKLLEFTSADPEALILNEDEMVAVAEESRGKVYAHPNGRLAEKNWVILDDRGQLQANEEGNNWYYFGKDALMVKNREKTIHKVKYRFDENGKMLSEAFGPNKDDGDRSTGSRQYYKHSGAPVEAGEWQRIDEEWYKFGDDGYCLASDSNAERTFDQDGKLVAGQKPEPDVTAIEALITDDETVKVGEEVELEFTITLASDSNVLYKDTFGTGRHDIWSEVSFEDVGRENLGSRSYKTGKITVENTSNPQEKTVRFTYTPLIPCDVTVGLVVDGQRSNGKYYVDATTKSQNSSAKNDAINQILESVGEGSSDEVSSELPPKVVRNSLAETFNTDEMSGEQEKEVRKALKENWLGKESEITTLTNNYVMENRIEEKDTDVEPEMLETLGINEAADIRVTGAALNASKSAGLAVKEPEDIIPDLGTDTKKRVDVDITLVLDDNENVTERLDIPVIITIPLPEGISADGLKVFHTTDSGETEEVDYDMDGNNIRFVADEFSVYSFANTGTSGGNTGGNTGGGSSSSDDGGSSSSSGGSGQWIQDTVGWWYRNADGSYLVNTWKQLSYNNVTDWYHFNAAGYMDFGWYTDANGDRFYLNPESNGFKGAMQTGWRYIDQKWFYFNPVSDGRKGAMLKDVVIDGYYIDGNGVRNEVR